MNLHYDLHVHSVLSPCADVLMTPNNILNMATLKGLDVLSVADHNSLKQIPILAKIAESYALLFIPGVEVTIADGTHVLCHFRRLDEAMAFDGDLERLLDKTPEGPVRNGEPILTDEEDLTLAVLPYRLHQNLPIDLAGLCRLLDRYEHLRFFAHLDRGANSGLHLVGTCPMDGIELTRHADPDFVRKHRLEGMPVLRNSDAHGLTDISERTDRNVLDLPAGSLDAFFARFARG